MSHAGNAAARRTFLQLSLALGGQALSGQGSAAAAWEAHLARWRGVRPRLFLSADRLNRLRESLNGTHAAQWTRARGHWNFILTNRRPPAYVPVRPGVTDAQLYQRDNGDYMIQMALAYLLTAEGRYLEACQLWANASCDYPTWATNQHLNSNLAAGHQLLGLAVVYDWLFEVLPEGMRRKIRATLVDRMPFMYDRGRNTVFWKDRVLDNHPYVSLAGFVAAAVALFDDAELEVRTKDWLRFGVQRFLDGEKWLESDGANHEGVAYWDYSTEYWLKFWHIAETCLGLKPSSTYWENTAHYRMHLSIPYKSWTGTSVNVDLGDALRHVWYGPDGHMRRLAALTRNPQAQWYADEIRRRNIDRVTTSWLSLVWFDPELAAEPMSVLPTIRYFESLGLVSARSGWDGEESLVVFKCGPGLGSHATKWLTKDNGDAAHAHPDANHFCVFGLGRWLIRDDGYLAIKKTENHNTLVVAKGEQLGGGGEWFDANPQLKVEPQPRILNVWTTEYLDAISGDATMAYPRAAGLRRYIRHLLFVKPGCLLVVDDIETDQPKELELRFHPERALMPSEDGSFQEQWEGGSLRLELLTSEGVGVETGVTRVRSDGAEWSLNHVGLKANRSRWRNAVVISWAKPSATTVTLNRESDEEWIFRSTEWEVVFAWDGSEPRYSRLS